MQSPRARCAEAAGAAIVCLPEPDVDVEHAQVDLRAMLLDLGKREVNELHVEAGGTLNGALLQAGLVDECVLVSCACSGPRGGGVQGNVASHLPDAPALDVVAVDKNGRSAVIATGAGRYEFLKSIDAGLVGVDHAHFLQILFLGGQLADARCDGGQLGGAEEHVGVLAQAVGEVAGAGGDHRCAFAHLGLVAHAQRAAGHLSTRACGAKGGVVAFFDQLGLVHLGGRCHPQFDGDVALAAQQLGCGAEVADVGHARADEGFVDRRARHFGQELGVVRVVGAADDGLFNVGQVDVDDGGVFSGLYPACRDRVASRLSLFFDAALQGFGVLVAVGDHVLHQHDVAGEVLLTGAGLSLMVQPAAERSADASDSSKACSTFRSGRPSISRILPRRNVFLPALGPRSQTALYGVQRNRVHQIAQGNAGLHLALEAHQHGFGHVKRHHAGGGAKGHQARACGEGDADGEARVRIAAGAHGVGQQQAVEPAVDDAIAWAQGHAAAVADEGGQLAVGFHVHGLGVGGGVAEGLHHHVGAKAQASQVFEFIARHGGRGVLRAHGGHAGFAIGAGAHALPFRQANGAAHHFLRQGKACF
ncbi:hypothetical protein FQA39_LY18995 [Lamprigera yunnana]|nr:hypothetical protein FQA39_LY18995 [Lamprigera yunnana]